MRFQVHLDLIKTHLYSSKAVQPSATVEEIMDNTDVHHSQPPQNPNHILELSDGSDDDDPAPPLIDVDKSDDEDDMDIEEVEENAEAELGAHSTTNIISTTNFDQHNCLRIGAHQSTYSSSQCLTLNMLITDASMYLSALQNTVRGAEMVGRFAVTLTRGMLSQLAICASMRRPAGERTQLLLLTRRRIFMLQGMHLPACLI